MSSTNTRNRGYIRVAACAPGVSVGDVDYNVTEILKKVSELESQGVEVAVFPELSVTAYTCADLFHSRVLLDAARDGMDRLCRETAGMNVAFAVGVPRERDGRLYNCAVLIHRGEVVLEADKTFLPNYDEFYERRFFSPAETGGSVRLYDLNGVKIGIEICEDLWTPVPVSSRLALAGADVVLNLSASDDITGKYDYLVDLVRQQSARCVCGYVYASAGFGESSTDLVFDGKAIVAENGSILASSTRWDENRCDAVADIDVEQLRRDRMHKGTFYEAKSMLSPYEVVVTGSKQDSFNIQANAGDEKLLRPIARQPFVPSGEENRARRCNEIVNIQVAGLAKRLKHTHCRSLVVGVSGGLDSTLALLVARKAFDRLGLDPAGITAVTMPGFGTTGRTHGNAVTLAELLGATLREISIVPAVEQHFHDIGHDPAVHDVTYENSQARQRTLLLMDIANQTGGMVLGTGDLSELALGWATYNGDHMSMYGVNAGVPKTLVRYLVEWFAFEASETGELRRVLLDIAATPVSPELLPPTASGEIAQVTEDLVGPYELHDFFLYHTLRFGSRPSKIFRLARQAFDGEYDDVVILKWLRTFFRRFFAQQFKRSCLPDGPKVGSVCLSPRGDWRMPSDASAATWLKEIDDLDAKYAGK